MQIIQIILLTIGFLTIFSVLSGLFFAFDKGPKSIFPNNPVPPVDSPDFLLALSRTLNVPVESGGTVEILNNGDEFFPALLNDISNAEKSINFTVYIWQDGNISDQIIEALIKKQKEGVLVRILLDGFGGKSAPDQKFAELMNAGGKVEKFRKLKFGKLTRFHRRSHRRAIIIDGKIGYVGGMAVKDVWLGNAQNPDQWRDIMFKVTGPMARSLQSAFSDLWTGATGEILFGLGTYPGDTELQSSGEIKFIHLINSPSDSILMSKFMLLSMMAAKQKLFINTPYFIPDKHLLKTLKERAKAGVDVRILLPGDKIDNKTARWNAQNYYYELLEEGVKIYEYQPTFIHSKYLIVDDLWSIIGSPNQNFRSRNWDEENAFGIIDSKLALDLKKIFENDSKQAKEISLKTWKKRGIFSRILVKISRIIEEQS